MAPGITPKRRKELEDRLKKHKPYTPEDPEYFQFDGEVDDDRMSATIAKKILDDNPNKNH